MKSINETIGLDKKTKESLKKKLTYFLINNTNLTKDDFNIDWNSPRDHYIYVEVKYKDIAGSGSNRNKRYNFYIKLSGTAKTQRRVRARMSSEDVLNKADGLVCKRVGNSAYLFDDTGTMIFKVNGLTPMLDLDLPDSALGTKEEPTCNDDTNNLILDEHGTIYTMLSDINRLV